MTAGGDHGLPLHPGSPYTYLMGSGLIDREVARAAVLERRRAFERVNEWERRHGSVPSFEAALEQLDVLYELVPPDLRRRKPDPDSVGVRLMQARLAVLSPFLAELCRETKR